MCQCYRSIGSVHSREEILFLKIENFRKWVYSGRSGVLLGIQFQLMLSACRTRIKVTGALKMIFLNLHNPSFYNKKTLAKKNIKIIICITIYFKMGKFGFELGKDKIKMFLQYFLRSFKFLILKKTFLGLNCFSV